MKSVLLLLAVAACQSPPTGPVSVPLTDAASIRLFTAIANNDWTAHIPLTTGYSTRMRVGLYTAAGREITPLLHPLDMSFSVTPATTATAVVADSALLLFDLTPTDTVGTFGDLRITLTEPATGTTKSYGPFQMLIHPL